MAGVRFKSLQAATPLLDEQFDRILFVVNLAQPNTTLCQTGAELKTAVVCSNNPEAYANIAKLLTYYLLPLRSRHSAVK